MLLKNKQKILLLLLVTAALMAAFFTSGDVPSANVPNAGGETPAADILPETEAFPESAPTEKEQSAAVSKPVDTEEPQPTPAPLPLAEEPEANPDRDSSDPVPTGKPLPGEPQDVTIGTAAYCCTISISCSTLLENETALDSAKADLLPVDGWVLQPTEVTFYEGESVFNVLQRTCKQQKIHMEFEDTPLYNSAYIEGIHNLYEFDAGELSGWMYSVNDWFPNYGCSCYQLENGDVICWVYTCDLGRDVGGEYSAGNGRG